MLNKKIAFVDQFFIVIMV